MRFVARLRKDGFRTFSRQVGWTLSSRLVAAALQMVTLALLARGLQPAHFAFVCSVQVALWAVLALNGFGIQRQITYRRSTDPQDPALSALFARQLRYTYASALIWLAVAMWFGVAAGDQRWLATTPLAIWLVAEQNVQIWNGIAIADGRARMLMPSWLLRRGPVVLLLLAAVLWNWNVYWAWSVGLASGGVVAYASGLRHQEPWARILVPRRRRTRKAATLDFGYWRSQVGEQLRDLDVPALTFVDPLVAGIYAFPARFVRPMNVVTTATGSVAFPVLSRRPQIARRHIFVGAVVGSTPTMLIAALLFSAAPLLPVIAGDAYRASVPTMQIICLATALGGPASLLVVFLQSRSGSATRAVGTLVLASNCLQLVAVVTGGILMGATGAALFYAAGRALDLLALVILTLRHTAHPGPAAASPLM